MIDAEHGNEPRRLGTERQPAATTEQVSDQLPATPPTIGGDEPELVQRRDGRCVRRRIDDDAASDR
jgi:hypothetical protein